jgi:hypothetical protein
MLTSAWYQGESLKRLLQGAAVESDRIVEIGGVRGLATDALDTAKNTG